MRFWLTRIIRAAALVPVLTLCVGAASLTGTLIVDNPAAA